MGPHQSRMKRQDAAPNRLETLPAGLDVEVFLGLDIAALGRVACASHGLRAACKERGWRWKAVAEIPRLDGISRAALAMDPANAFDWAAAYRSNLWCEHYVAPVRPEVELINGGERLDERELSGIVITFELCSCWSLMGGSDDSIGSDGGRLTPFFSWSGPCTLVPEGPPDIAANEANASNPWWGFNTPIQTPPLWTPQTVPFEMQRWLDESYLHHHKGNDFRFGGKQMIYMYVYLTRNSKSVTLYYGLHRHRIEADGLHEFTHERVAHGPCLGERDPVQRAFNEEVGQVSDYFLEMLPEMDHATGRITLHGSLGGHGETCPLWTTKLLRHIADIEMNLGMPQTGRLREESSDSEEDDGDAE